MSNSLKKNISEEIDYRIKNYEKENGYKPSFILLDFEKYEKLKMYCRDHYLGDIDETSFRISNIPVLKKSNITGIKLIDNFTPILLNDLLDDTLTKSDISRIDQIRSDWFNGLSNKTPVEILNSIPTDIHFLIKCIDKLHTENLEIKGNISWGPETI